jgi:hypothetical protein
MKSSESRSNKTPVTGLFEDHHHEQIFSSRLPKSLFCCVFGSMEERGALPKVLSTREKAGYPEWIVKTNATLPDGKKLAATNIITRNGSDAITWQSKERTLDGKALPDVAEITMDETSGIALALRTEGGRLLAERKEILSSAEYQGWQGAEVYCYC